nr:hypothetical protein [Tanacetum cinerariifolium]
MLLYIERKEQRVMLLDSIFSRPFKFKEIIVIANEATVRPAETRMQTWKDLTPEEKIRKECDIRVANIILHGLPNDIYTLLNHKKKAYDICRNGVDLLQGSSKQGIFMNYKFWYNLPMSVAAQQKPYIPQPSYETPTIYQQPPDVYQQPSARPPLPDSGFVVSTSLPMDDPIASLNKAMTFLTTVISSRYPPTNNQLRTPFNPRTQANIQDGRVVV